MKVAIGIDLGKQGWLSVVDDSGTLVASYATPLLSGGGYNAQLMLDRLRLLKDVTLCVLEDAVTLPGQQSAKTGLAIGEGLGLWRMGLVAAGIKHEIVAPRAWKAAMGCLVAPGAKAKRPSGLKSNELQQRVATIKRRKNEGAELTTIELALLEEHKATNHRSADRRKAAKAASEEVAVALFPGFDFRETERCKNLHDGKVESALLALYALRRSQGRA